MPRPTPPPHCTLENNEICALGLSQFEEPDDPLRGGISVLKPKWVFRLTLLMENAKGIGPGSFSSLLVDVDSERIVEPIWKQRSAALFNQRIGKTGGNVLERWISMQTLPLAPGKHMSLQSSGVGHNENAFVGRRTNTSSGSDKRDAQWSLTIDPHLPKPEFASSKSITDNIASNLEHKYPRGIT
ncbi:hypothetical protein Ocin01_19324 [Orchesella cincta]|uniref:Uncharacterized protein n=1 Tax=Orchesella cincta TaxID=48709 RepID=A0A1D2M312_ORCCI|nr:hypothetical protein Ocin01_19324 [Orchesella cincta]